MNKRFLRKIFLSISSLLLIALFMNATPPEFYSQISELSGSAVTAAYEELVANSSSSTSAVGYDLVYGAPPSFQSAFNNTEIKGIAKYNASTQRIEIYINPALKDDPIGAGWIIQHEFLHGVTGYDVDHSLAGSFGNLGSKGKIDELEHFDHVPAFQVNLAQLPNIVSEYLDKGKTAEAIMAAAQFDLIKTRYLNASTLQYSTLKEIGNALTSTVISNLKSQPIKNAKDAYGYSISKVEFDNTRIEAQKTSNANGFYKITLIVTNSSGLQSFIELESKTPLEAANLESQVDRFSKKIKDGRTTLANRLSSPEFDAIRSKLSNLLQPKLNQLNNSTTLAFYPATSLGTITLSRLTMKGFKISASPSDGEAEVKTGTAVIEMYIDGQLVSDSRGPFSISTESPTSEYLPSGSYDHLNSLIDYEGSNLIPEDYSMDGPY